MTSRRHWLLDLEIDGRPYRWAVGQVSVETLDGEVLEYGTGLQELELARGETGVAVSLLDPSVDWPELAPELECRTATLRRWVEGEAWEEATVYAHGQARAVKHGARSEPVRFVLEEEAGAEESLGLQCPDPLAQVDATTWPVSGGAALGDEGGVYPVILGYPGYTGNTNPVPVVPCPLGQWNSAATTYVVVAEDGLQPITQVRVRNVELNAEATETAVQVSDNLGRKVRCSHFTTSTTPMPADATQRRELYVGYSPSGGGGPRAAYDVIAYLLRRWGELSVDWARLPEVAEFLSQVQVDTWIDAPLSDPWAWIEGTLLTHLPIEIRRTERGRYLVPKRYRSDPARRVGSVDADRGEAVRIGDKTVAAEGPFNEFTALYRFGPSGDPLGRVVLTGDSGRVLSAPTLILPPSVATTQIVSVVTSSFARASHGRYRLRQYEEGAIEIDWTWDTGTVVRVLELLAERYALPSELVTYEIEDGDELEEGDEFLLTDSALGLSERPAIVDGPPVVDSSRRAVVDLRLPP